ncbi:hypothetical protein [Siphonobacter sp.]|uniref:hypothetical protein n=1 Tax=Siphonobacter sp. TaxID=1869184 RepID=UPI003B3BA1E5
MTPKQLLGTACFVGALLTSSGLMAQVKVGTNPTTIETNSNLEVEASTSGRKVKVDKTTGQMTIADGTQGAGKVLTSDANGGASWSALEAIKIPQTMFIGFQADGEQLIVPASSSGAVNSRFKVVPLPSYAANYNAARRAYIIPAAGYYRVELGVRCTGTGPTGVINPSLAGRLGVSDIYSVGVNAANARSFMHTQYYNAGEEVYGYLYLAEPGAGDVITTNTYMTVTRLHL